MCPLRFQLNVLLFQGREFPRRIDFQVIMMRGYYGKTYNPFLRQDGHIYSTITIASSIQSCHRIYICGGGSLCISGDFQ